ncbi:hypothetical protein BG015_011484 [Linnemannia schmuckeri]|uniref:Small ribosomal subunit protein mS38 n=1 Tax=Linnemannia schmuckeri TaxID=64567 RepID=A0A9P5RW22_9FUNG|nr:hypothetical protein BG015_011484 [Linnemannia schmuckeri]
MFTRLIKRASGPAQFFRTATHHNNIRNRILPINNINHGAVISFNSIRHQSSSSSSRDNDNSNNQDIEPISSNDVPINASIELHRVDLAHGSFFAMHRPLLGIANGPMFANNPVDDLVNYFSTLHPYSPPSPMIQTALVTPTATAWASMAPSMPDAELAVEEFLRLVEDKQILQEQQKEEGLRKQSAATIAAGNMDGIDEGSITANSILDPVLQDGSNAMHMTSVLRKRRIKMRKHKYKKLRKRTRALRKKLGK